MICSQWVSRKSCLEKIRTEVIWNHTRSIESLWFVILQCIVYIYCELLLLFIFASLNMLTVYDLLSNLVLYIESWWFVISACLEILRRAGWPLLSVRITFCQTGIMVRSAQTGKIFRFKTIFLNCKKKYLEELLRFSSNICVFITNRLRVDP